MYRYTAYGLGISSALPLPELTAGETTIDVVIRMGNVECDRLPIAAGEHYFRASEEQVYLFWKHIGAFLIRGGREIILDPMPDVDETALRLFLLGPALAVLLHQRDRLVLHASAVAVNGGAVLFLGGSEWGKSTMAACLYARGRGIIADDVVAVDLRRSENPMVAPGFPQLKLWPDTIGSVGASAEALPRVHPRLDKRACRAARGFPRVCLPLTHIYVLDRETGHAIEPLAKQDALIELVRHSYAVRLLQQTNASLHFSRCASVAARLPVRRLKRLHSLSSLPELGRIVENDLA